MARLDLLVLVGVVFSAGFVNRLPFPGIMLHLRKRIAAGAAFFLGNVVTMPATSPAAYVRYLVELSVC